MGGADAECVDDVIDAGMLKACSMYLGLREKRLQQDLLERGGSGLLSGQTVSAAVRCKSRAYLVCEDVGMFKGSPW